MFSGRAPGMGEMTERLLRLKVYALIVACSCDSTFPVSLQLKVDRALMENGTKAASHADDLTLPGSRGFRSCSQAARESRLSHPSPVASHTWLAQKWQRAPPSSARQSSSWRKMVALERSFKASVLQPHGRTNAVMMRMIETAARDGGWRKVSFTSLPASGAGAAASAGGGTARARGPKVRGRAL